MTASSPFTRAQLFDRLATLGIATSTLDHPAVFTVSESQGLERALPGAHTKNLFLKCKKGQLYLVVAQHDTQVDLKSLHKTIGSGRLSFGNADLLWETLGVRPGSVTPFSLINDVQHKVSVILDARMMESDILNFHPLENTATTSISRDDFISFVAACGHVPRIETINRAGDVAN